MIPDANLGGNLTTMNEGFHEMTRSRILSLYKAWSSM